MSFGQFVNRIPYSQLIPPEERSHRLTTMKTSVFAHQNPNSTPMKTHFLNLNSRASLLTAALLAMAATAMVRRHVRQL